MSDAKQVHDADQWVAGARNLGAAAGAMYDEASRFMPPEAARAVAVAYVSGLMGSLGRTPPKEPER